MKRFVFVVLALAAFVLPLKAQVAAGEESVLPRGVMTYNPWSGKISVAGETIPKDLLGHYFDEADLKEFKTSQGLYVGALVSAVVGGVATGVGLALMIPVWTAKSDPAVSVVVPEGDKTAGTACLIAGGVGIVMAFVLDGIASHKRKTVIGKYNAQLTFQPELKFGATANGMGLALAF